jgi:hypothetical protein
MHCQSTHGVKSRNAIIIPDQVVGEFRKHAETIRIVNLDLSSTMSCMSWFPLLCRFDTTMLALPSGVQPSDHARY